MIKKILTLTVSLIFICLSVQGQAPEKMSYQAVIRDGSDNLLVNTTVGMQISILQGSATGTAVYEETHTPMTNANGLVSLEIGTGTVVSGIFASINWSGYSHYIKTGTDPLGGIDYSSIEGTSELLSVPYALHSKTTAGIPTGGTEGQILTIDASGNPVWTTQLKVGAPHPDHGGIIFHLDASGEHGLLAAATDQGLAEWGCGNDDIQSDYNTAEYASALGESAPQCGEVGSAADLCTALGPDWYLPSLAELNLMYRTIGQGAPAPTNVGGFGSSYYWSSTEFDGNDNAWDQDFSNGFQYNYPKDYNRYVRAVRAF
jgi:hypothetical protein